MAQVFVISDTHFFHSKVIEFEHTARPFDTVEQMNEEMVDVWNKVVTKRDLVYHLGDVCFGKATNLEIMSRLNGQKKLIMGNHDVYGVREYLKYFREVEACKKYDGFILTHIPIHPNELYRFEANVHGHLHSKVVIRPQSATIEDTPDPRYINVSCEHTGLAPIAWEAIKKRVQ